MYSHSYFAREVSGLTGAKLRVFEQYCYYADPTGERSHPSQSHVGEKAGVCRKTVQRLTKALELEGHLERHGTMPLLSNSGRYTVVYRLRSFQEWVGQMSHEGKTEMSHEVVSHEVHVPRSQCPTNNTTTIDTSGFRKGLYRESNREIEIDSKREIEINSNGIDKQDSLTLGGKECPSGHFYQGESCLRCEMASSKS